MIIFIHFLLVFICSDQNIGVFIGVGITGSLIVIVIILGFILALCPTKSCKKCLGIKEKVEKKPGEDAENKADNIPTADGKSKYNNYNQHQYIYQQQGNIPNGVVQPNQMAYGQYQMYQQNQIYPPSQPYQQNQIYPPSQVYQQNQIYPPSQVYQQNQIYPPSNQPFNQGQANPNPQYYIPAQNNP